MKEVTRRRLARRRCCEGFTLVELLIVIAIVGILLATAVASYLTFRARGQNSAAQASVRSAVPAVEAYYADNETYVGMTVPALRALDAGLTITVIGVPNATSYCIRSNTQPFWYKQGPDGVITQTACAGP